MSDFHRASSKKAWLRQCRMINKSTETENCYKGLNRELRWLRNSVYILAFLKRPGDLDLPTQQHKTCASFPIQPFP